MTEEIEKNQYGIDDDVLQYLENLAKTSERSRSTDQRALAIMLELVKAKHAAFLLLRDDDIGKWWGKKVSTAENRVATWKREIKEYEIKIAAYNRLSAAERKIVGIRKPVKPADLGIYVEEIT